MGGKQFSRAAWLASLLLVSSVGMAAEPVLDLRTPVLTDATRSLATLRVDDRPVWLQRMDSVVRTGWTFACLRHGQQADFVLGAHPNGYIGVFTTPSAAGSRRKSC